MNTQDKERQRIGLYIGLGVGACVLLVLSLVVGIVLGIVINKNIHRTPVFNSSVIKQKLSMCSELTTATLEYHGEVEFDEGEFRWIDKKHFTMEYDAYIEAGIDLSRTELEIQDNVIYVTIPEVEVQNVVIDPNSLVFRDESFSLFNWKSHEDVAEALQYAEQDADLYVEETRLVEQARQQAEDVIRTLLQPIIDDEQNRYEIVLR